MTQEPFLENACCNTTFRTLDFFSDKDGSIMRENNKVKEYEAIYNRLHGLAKAPILFNGANTKKPFINVFLDSQKKPLIVLLSISVNIIRMV